jgi:hypothetical protein
MEHSAALRTIGCILAEAGSADARIPPTLLYNEGWLLRLALAAEEAGAACLPFRFAPGARWFSEALLASPFLARHRGDPLAEAWTHADGVAGHFEFAPASKAGLRLRAEGSQFAVLEAKVFSPLSRGTKRAPEYGQAARNVACMAETLRRAGRPLEQWGRLAFHVLAPQSQIEAGVFAAALARESIASSIACRIAAYDGARRRELDCWYEAWALPLLARMCISTIAWESAAAGIAAHSAAAGRDFAAFYELTLRHNARPAAAR